MDKRVLNLFYQKLNINHEERSLTFYQELDIRREQWGLPWAQVDAQSGVSSTTRIRMAQGTEPSAEDMAKLRIWLRE